MLKIRVIRVIRSSHLLFQDYFDAATRVESGDARRSPEPPAITLRQLLMNVEGPATDVGITALGSLGKKDY
jgi:hypothetical protein